MKNSMDTVSSRLNTTKENQWTGHERINYAEVSTEMGKEKEMGRSGGE